MDKLQQTFLMSCPIVAKEDYLVIHLLDGFFEEQFVLMTVRRQSSIGRYLIEPQTKKFLDTSGRMKRKPGT